MRRPPQGHLRGAALEAARQLGAQAGVEGLTMRALAGRIGVTATALYQHFESKGHLLRELALHGAASMYAELAQHAELADPVERCAAYARAYLAFVDREPWVYWLLMEFETLDWTRLGGEARERYVAPLALVESAFAEGVERGRLRPGLEPRVAALKMWACLHGLCSLRLHARLHPEHPAFPSDDAEPFERFVGEFIATMVRGWTAS